jgi:hypothetical protein
MWELQNYFLQLSSITLLHLKLNQVDSNPDKTSYLQVVDFVIEKDIMILQQ